MPIPLDRRQAIALNADEAIVLHSVTTTTILQLLSTGNIKRRTHGQTHFHCCSEAAYLPDELKIGGTSTVKTNDLIITRVKTKYCVCFSKWNQMYFHVSMLAAPP